MATAKRPGTAELAIPLPGGQIVNREAPIRWISPFIGYADVPTMEVGRKVRCLCVWDGAGKSMMFAPEGPPLTILMDAVLLAVVQTGNALDGLRKRVAKLEGFAAGEAAESEANAPAGPLRVLGADEPPPAGTP
ncbi:MAG TPA: hypothetical protein VJP77_05655 [Planctomycetota bacterium]|nr:hypothetical protein [Planctomycetota bacterium]